MTTTANNQPRSTSVPPWARDTIGNTQVIDSTPHYTIQDMAFDDAWLRSDTSYRLDKMR